MDEEQGIQLKNPYALRQSIRSIGAKEEGAASTAQKVGGFFVTNWRALFSVSILILIVVTISNAVAPNACVCPGGIPSDDVDCPEDDENCNTCSKDGDTSCKSCTGATHVVDAEFQCVARDCGTCLGGTVAPFCTENEVNICVSCSNPEQQVLNGVCEDLCGSEPCDGDCTDNECVTAVPTPVPTPAPTNWPTAACTTGCATCVADTQGTTCLTCDGGWTFDASANTCQLFENFTCEISGFFFPSWSTDGGAWWGRLLATGQQGECETSLCSTSSCQGCPMGLGQLNSYRITNHGGDGWAELYLNENGVVDYMGGCERIIFCWHVNGQYGRHCTGLFREDRDGHNRNHVHKCTYWDPDGGDAPWWPAMNNAEGWLNDPNVDSCISPLIATGTDLRNLLQTNANGWLQGLPPGYLYHIAGEAKPPVLSQ
jgi:hypothetical protein